MNDIELWPFVTHHGIINTGARSDLKNFSYLSACPQGQIKYLSLFPKRFVKFILKYLWWWSFHNLLIQYLRNQTTGTKEFWNFLWLAYCTENELRLQLTSWLDWILTKLWCRQELDWNVYGKRDLNPVTTNSSLNPKEFFWYQWGYPCNILLFSMKKGTRICPFDKIDRARRWFWISV